jgi:hypothetical protein
MLEKICRLYKKHLKSTSITMRDRNNRNYKYVKLNNKMTIIYCLNVEEINQNQYMYYTTYNVQYLSTIWKTILTIFDHLLINYNYYCGIDEITNKNINIPNRTYCKRPFYLSTSYNMYAKYQNLYNIFIRGCETINDVKEKLYIDITQEQYNIIKNLKYEDFSVAELHEFEKEFNHFSSNIPLTMITITYKEKK